MVIKQDYTHENIDGTSTGTTELGPVAIMEEGATARVKKVVVEQQGASDVEFNVNFGGQAVFSDTQTVSANNTFEEFTPDQNFYEGPSFASLEFDVTSPGSSTPVRAGATVEVQTDE